MDGTRLEIEKYLLEFIYNLKYYSTRWLRARNYAEMAGFLHVESSLKYFRHGPNRSDSVLKQQMMSDKTYKP